MMVLRRLVLSRLLLIAAAPILILLAWATTALAAPPAATPPTPHTLEGRTECLTCHAQGTQLAVPADHADRSNATCVACHAAAQTPAWVEATPPAISAPIDAAPTSPAPVVTPPPGSSDRNAACLTCHANPDLKVKFPDGSELSAHVDETTLHASTHGPVGPTCTDCHSNINGYPHPQVEARSAREYSANMRSSLPSTCNQCHSGANATFAAAWTGHAKPTAQNEPLVYYVNLAYAVIIPVTVLSLLAFIGLDTYRRARNRFRPER